MPRGGSNFKLGSGKCATTKEVSDTHLCRASYSAMVAAFRWSISDCRLLAADLRLATCSCIGTQHNARCAMSSPLLTGHHFSLNSALSKVHPPHLADAQRSLPHPSPCLPAPPWPCAAAPQPWRSAEHAPHRTHADNCGILWVEMLWHAIAATHKQGAQLMRNGSKCPLSGYVCSSTPSTCASRKVFSSLLSLMASLMLVAVSRSPSRSRDSSAALVR